MRKTTPAAFVAAMCGMVAACTIDARPNGNDGTLGAIAPKHRKDGGTMVATDAGTPAPTPAPDAGTVVPRAECVVHSDCPAGQSCMNGTCATVVGHADAGTPAPPPCTPVNEICDGSDNDCDGFTDEGCPPAPPPPPPPPRCIPSPEVCDGLDNDCDGSTDEAPPGPHGDQSCAVSVPQAGVTIPGLLVCVIGVDGHVRTECLPNCGTAEVCGNDLDDNCDGRTNEHCPGRCESDAQCAAGQVCVGNEPFNGTCATPVAESCNGRDDDGDGLVDEGNLCPTGQSCVNGQCILPDVVLESCNGVDDNHDGQTDEGAVCPTGQTCGIPSPACPPGPAGTACPYPIVQCYADRDRDTVPDGSDNCPGVANFDQRDGDGDGVGDACDNCAATRNADQADANHNGVGDACEPVSPPPPPPPANHVQVSIEVPSSIVVSGPLFCDDFDGGWDCVPVTLDGPTGRRILVDSPFTPAEHRFNVCFSNCDDPVRGQWGANQARGVQAIVNPEVRVGTRVVPYTLQDNRLGGANWLCDLR